MKRLLFRAFCCFALITGAAMSLPAQTTTFVTPVPFYRFRVSDANLGYLYTASFQEGINAGFTPDGILHNGNGVFGYVVVPPTQDSVPVAGQGLVPLHRLRIIESGRAYWYLTTALFTYGSNYTYEGIAGYALNLTDPRPGFTLTAYYSQRYGYWFAVDGERLPDGSFEFSPYGGPLSGDCQFLYINPVTGLYYCSTYKNHGSIAKLMQGPSGSFQFTTPAPPPPPPPPPGGGEGGGSCNVAASEKRRCSQLGGLWDYESCSCQY